MAYGPRDPKHIARDLVIVFRHDDFKEKDALNALAELKEARRA